MTIDSADDSAPLDVALDGKRFLLIREGAPAEQDGGPASLVVRLNVANVLNARLLST